MWRSNVLNCLRNLETWDFDRWIKNIWPHLNTWSLWNMNLRRVRVLGEILLPRRRSSRLWIVSTKMCRKLLWSYGCGRWAPRMLLNALFFRLVLFWCRSFEIISSCRDCRLSFKCKANSALDVSLSLAVTF
jgi:hypothetical protein